MHTITAFHCDHCKKVYENKDSARLHESRCYWNTETRSCASCAFLDLLQYEFEPGYSTQFQVCLQNFDITNRLKTRCEKYHQAELFEGYGFKINIPDYDFDKGLALNRLKGQIENRMKLHEEHKAERMAEEIASAQQDEPTAVIDFPW